MVITQVRIRRKEDTGTRLKGIASINLDNMLVIHDIKIIESDEGYFLAMPSKVIPNGSFKDIAHPISKDVREVMEEIIINGVKYMESNDLSDGTWNIAEDNTSKFLDLKFVDYSFNSLKL